MQIAVIEFARNVAGLENANSIEFDPETPYPVVCLMEAQKQLTTKGGNMRLGAYSCKLQEGSLSSKAYGQKVVYERHRHRFEFNNAYGDELKSSGLSIGGINPDNDLVEIIEIADHPWFVAVQFHPEFKSKPNAAHPLFASFIEAALKRRK